MVVERGHRAQGLSRRRFLQAAGAGAGALILAGAGYGVDQAVSGSSAPREPRFSSAPEIDPPPTSVLVPAADTAAGFVAVTPWDTGMTGQRGPLLLDNGARPVWFRDVAPRSASNLQVQQYQGRPVLAWWEGQLIPAGYGKGEYHVVDGAYREVATVRAAGGFSGDLHELVLTPRGTAMFTVYGAHPADLGPVGGSDRGVLLDSYLQEVDVATGQLLFQWQASKHVALDESYLAPPAPGTPYDFFHINSICEDTDGDLVVSGRHPWTVYKISRQSGAVLWRLGGKLSSFAMDPTDRCSWQHDARVQPGGRLSVFDDGGGVTGVETRSRGMVLALDLAAMRATLTAQFFPDPSIVSTSQGSVQPLPGGNTFVGWGEQPSFSEYGSQGQLVFVGKLPPEGSYRAYRFPWVGHPAGPPAAALRRDAGGSLAVAALGARGGVLGRSRLMTV